MNILFKKPYYLYAVQLSLKKQNIMKKLFFFLGATSIALSSFAQHAMPGNTVQPSLQLSDAANRAIKADAVKRASATTSTASGRTTAAVTSRWYTYYLPFDTANVMNTNTTGQIEMIMWNDTGGKVNYTTGGLARNPRLSVGETFHPQWHGYFDGTYAHPGFNSPYFPGEMYLPGTQPYSIDSIILLGTYNVNPAKTGVIDTLVLTFMTGGSTLSTGYYTGAASAAFLGNYGLTGSDSLWVAEPLYNPATNTQKSRTGGTGTAPYTMKYTLSHADWADSNAYGVMVRPIRLTTPLVAQAGEIVSVSVSFKSGDASFPASTVTGDTLSNFLATGNPNKYNQFRPLTYYALNGTVTDWCNPHYSHPRPKTDWNGGYFAQHSPFDSSAYFSMYAWSNATTGGGYYTQHVNIQFHVVCPTCDIEVVSVPTPSGSIRNIAAYPNPAVDEFNIACTIANGVNATVTLTNTLGQVVATQAVNNGKATFNTTTIPAGLYVYTITANGEHTTGNVDITH